MSQSHQSETTGHKRRGPRPTTLALTAGGLAGVAVVSVAVVSVAVLGVATVSTAGAATPSPTPSAGSKAPSIPVPPAGAPARGPGGGPGFGPGPGGPEPHGGPRGAVGGDLGPLAGGPAGVVTAVSGTRLTVKSPQGASKTYTLTSTTKYQAGPGATIAAGDIAVGDRVAVRTSGATSTTATEVDEQLPRIDGTVVSVAGSTITVTDNDGFQRIIDTTASTTYTKSGKSAAASAVTAGSHINATGRVDADKTSLDASSVDVVVPPTS